MAPITRSSIKRLGGDLFSAVNKRPRIPVEQEQKDEDPKLTEEEKGDNEFEEKEEGGQNEFDKEEEEEEEEQNELEREEEENRLEEKGENPLEEEEEKNQFEENQNELEEEEKAENSSDELGELEEEEDSDDDIWCDFIDYDLDNWLFDGEEVIMYDSASDEKRQMVEKMKETTPYKVKEIPGGVILLTVY